MAIYKSSNSGIPFGNTAGRPSSPGTGQPYFNGELQRLELYTGATYGWQNIVAETPGVTGYTGNVTQQNLTNTITITGTNFASGATATLIGQDGTEYTATSTTVSNLTSITAVFGVIPQNNEPYDIKVTNPSNLYGVYYDILTVNDAPIWTTAAGSLGSFGEGSAVSIQLVATDEENSPLTYSISSGSLPSGLSLNSSTGVISGTIPTPSSNATSNFTISVTDGQNISPRIFSISTNDIITWNTASNLGTISDVDAASYSLQLSASSSYAITYSLFSGSLPSGATLSSSGLLSGTIASVSVQTTYNFTIRALTSFGYEDRAFTLIQSAKTGNQVVEALIVGGGAAGGNGNINEGGGGGGAGGVLYTTTWNPAVGSYSFAVGSKGIGGVGSSADNVTAQIAPTNSYIESFIALGGGKGANGSTGFAGGSGGGGSGFGSAQSGGSAQQTSISPFTGYGNAGGSGQWSGSGQNGAGGGGGGASGSGASGATDNQGGAGGAGISLSITGSAYTYSKGGKGGRGTSQGANTTDNGVNYGDGGRGIGGSGSNMTAGNGQDGVIIIAIPTTRRPISLSGATYTTSTARAGYTVYTITAGTGTITFK